MKSRLQVPLTNKEVSQIERRVEEIKRTLSMCGEFEDADVIANLYADLEAINQRLDGAAEVAEQEERREASGLLRFKQRRA